MLMSNENVVCFSNCKNMWGVSPQVQLFYGIHETRLHWCGHIRPWERERRFCCECIPPFGEKVSLSWSQCTIGEGRLHCCECTNHWRKREGCTMVSTKECSRVGWDYKRLDIALIDCDWRGVFESRLRLQVFRHCFNRLCLNRFLRADSDCRVFRYGFNRLC